MRITIKEMKRGKFRQHHFVENERGDGMPGRVWHWDGKVRGENKWNLWRKTQVGVVSVPFTVTEINRLFNVVPAVPFINRTTKVGDTVAIHVDHHTFHGKVRRNERHAEMLDVHVPRHGIITTNAHRV